MKNPNIRNGHHYSSSYWKTYRAKVLPNHLAESLILGDARKLNTYFKIEQGYKNKEYLMHLFELFKDWVFREAPYERLELYGERRG